MSIVQELYGPVVVPPSPLEISANLETLAFQPIIPFSDVPITPENDHLPRSIVDPESQGQEQQGNVDGMLIGSSPITAGFIPHSGCPEPVERIQRDADAGSRIF